MHKDCIILCHQTEADGSLTCLKRIGEKTFLEFLTEYLSKYHICKIIFSISHQLDNFKKYILDHRDQFSFAFDFAEQEEYFGTGSAILHALQFSDTPDVLIMQGHKYFDVQLDDLIAWQQTKMGDVTAALTYQADSQAFFAHLNEENYITQITRGNSGQKGLMLSEIYCLFRPSFLNINFPNSFSFEEDYLLDKIKERDFVGVIWENGYFDMHLTDDVEKFKRWVCAETNDKHTSQ